MVLAYTRVREPLMVNATNALLCHTVQRLPVWVQIRVCTRLIK